MTALPLLFARHVVTVFHFLDALSTLVTLSDAPPVIEGLQQGHHFVLFRSLFMLCSGMAFLPLTTVRETGRYTLAVVVRDDRRPVLGCMLLAGATTRASTPPPELFFIALQAVAPLWRHSRSSS